MSSIDKLIKRLKSKPKNFTWDELTRLFDSLHFEEIVRGKTGGSRRKFYNKKIRRGGINIIKNDLMNYKGYLGSVHFNAHEELFFGKVEFIRDLISYEASGC